MIHVASTAFLCNA